MRRHIQVFRQLLAHVVVLPFLHSCTAEHCRTFGQGSRGCALSSYVTVVTITPGAIAEAGPDNNICEDENFTFSSAFATNSSLVTWSTSGDGQFDNINLVNPIYTPGPNDILNGNVMLTISANGNGNCTGDTDNMTLFIISLPNPGPIQHN